MGARGRGGGGGGGGVWRWKLKNEMAKRRSKKKQEEAESGEEAIRRELRTLCAMKTTVDTKRQCVQELKHKMNMWSKRKMMEENGKTMRTKKEQIEKQETIYSHRGEAHTESLTTSVVRGVLEGALGGKKGVHALPGYRGNQRARYVHACVCLCVCVWNKRIMC